VMTSFQHGLEVEIAGRKAFVASKNVRLSEDEYHKCEGGIRQTPEAQKINSAMANLPDDVSTEQMMSAMKKVGLEMMALTLRKCGENPSVLNGPERSKAMEKAEQDGANELGKVFDADSDDGPDALEAASAFHGPYAPESGIGAHASAIDPQTALNRYRFLKEWLPPFCSLDPNAQSSAASNGVHIPGSSPSMAYVYTASEAAAIKPVCAAIMALLGNLQ